MATWTPDELAAIGDAYELEISSRRKNGTLSPEVTIWAIRLNDTIVIRSVNGPEATWYRSTQIRPTGRIWSGGVERDVAFQAPDGQLDEDQVDAAYRAKFGASSSATQRITAPLARHTSLRLTPIERASPTGQAPLRQGDSSVSTSDSSGRVAVITGASSGIGEATARALAADGHRVALLARRSIQITQLAEELAGAVAITADVTDRDSLLAAARQIKDELGGADILVNNAGVMLLGPFGEQQHEDYAPMLQTNLFGAITATEVFLSQLQDGGGDLINISSVAGRTARPGNAVYAASKWGMNGWSESLRQELQPDVRVMVIEPGAVATELTNHITHAETKAGAEKMYEDNAITAQDIAEVIAFAVSRPRSVSLNEILIRPSGQSL